MSGKLPPMSDAIVRYAHDGEAVAIDGFTAAICAMAGQDTRQVDLGGHRVLPGLTDSHFHYYNWALNRRRLELADTASLTAVCAQAAKVTAKTPPGGWIMGQGWN